MGTIEHERSFAALLQNFSIVSIVKLFLSFFLAVRCTIFFVRYYSVIPLNAVFALLIGNILLHILSSLFFFTTNSTILIVHASMLLGLRSILATARMDHKTASQG